MPNLLWTDPLFGVTITFGAYALSQWIHQKWNKAHPLFMTAGLIILFLLLSGIPYVAYMAGGKMVEFLLGPATVALGVPLYKHAGRIKAQVVPIMAGITSGAVSSIASSAALVWAFGGSRELLLTMLSKSASTPISIEIVRSLGGLPELGAVLTVMTGLLGSMIGPEFLRLCGVRGDIAVATAVGTGAHGIGTARLIRESETRGSISSFAMGVAGILTSILLAPLAVWLQ